MAIGPKFYEFQHTAPGDELHGGGGSAARAVEATRDVDAIVVALIPEYEQVQVRDEQGHLYALTLRTRGVDLEQLHAGQRVRCTVTLRLPRVLSATAIA